MMGSRVLWNLLHVLSLFCSQANSQDAPPRPGGQAQPLSPPAQRANAVTTHAAARQGSVATQNPISPRRDATAGDRNSLPTKEPYSIWRMLGALILVVAGIFGVAKLFKSLGVGPFGPVRQIPGSVCEILGVTTIPHRHTLYLLRMGQKVLLMSSTGESLTVLSEITEPQEVASITHLCAATRVQESESPSFFSRLLNHASPPQNPDDQPVPPQPNARQELEARLNVFAQS
jgi:flagellar biogenesis protein FliO